MRCETAMQSAWSSWLVSAGSMLAELVSGQSCGASSCRMAASDGSAAFASPETCISRWSLAVDAADAA